MKRYATRVEDGVVFVEADKGWLEVGTTADIVDLAGGHTYEIEYEESVASAYDWLDTDEGGRLSFDVLEVVESMTYPESFVRELEGVPFDEDDTVPRRTEFFVTALTDIWENTGRPTGGDSS